MLAEKLVAILPHLNERQRRLLLDTEARSLGRGAINRVSRASGVSRPTITKAVRGLEEPTGSPGRVRRAGAGRKSLRDRDPVLIDELEALVEPESRGDPMSPLRWSCRNFVHPKVAKPVTLAGRTGADAKHYQERAVRLAIEESTR